jgi:poly(3-hydroxybutyrate) depolymerase
MTHSARWAAGLLLLGLAPLAGAQQPSDLPPLGVDADDVSVVGVSSGGYMATQLAVAWPGRFVGLGVLAAGPWSCAQGALSLALGQCMGTRQGQPDLDEIDRRLREYRARDLVGNASDLADLRVFIWHGEEAETVEPALGRLLAEQFRGWLEDPQRQLRLRLTEEAGHGWPVGDPTGPVSPSRLASCRKGGGTHLLDCDLDIAGRSLSWLHGDLEAPAESLPSEDLISFDQTDFIDGKGFDEGGYLFVPGECQEGGCGLTMALHGCSMGAEQIDDTFVRYNGLNEWAATNRHVILYPQAETSMANPQGCWDWWGFAESTWQLDPLHDTRQGTQVRVLMSMLDRLEESPKD